VSPVAQVVYIALLLFVILMIFRLVMDYVFMLARSFRPQGAFAIACELTYSATDPPIKAVRKVLPPLRVGNISLDLAFMVVLIVTYVLMNVVSGL
jgi:YggT family protein